MILNIQLKSLNKLGEQTRLHINISTRLQTTGKEFTLVFFSGKMHYNIFNSGGIKQVTTCKY